MRAYETTFILMPTLDEAGVRSEVDAVKKTIESFGGEVSVDKEWGKRRLAFPIQDQSEGVYHVLRFSMPPAKQADLDRYFKLNERVLRALVIRDEGTPLEVLNQPSESDDYRDRDRDGGYERRGGRPPHRSEDRPDRSGPPAATATAEAPAAPSTPAQGEVSSE